jgi:integrase
MARKKRSDGTRAPNGASTIYYSEYDGKWHGRVTVGIRDNGKPDRRHIKRGTEADVIRAVRELENKRSAGRVKKVGQAWTVETWLAHWVEYVAAPTVRRTTMVGYRSSVYNHLIPGVGAHRLDRLRPEHLEALYQRLQVAKPKGKGLKPATVHLAHRTIRVALNEALRRGHIVENPATIAKAPRVDEDEIVPFTPEEARRILDVADDVRNGARFVVALTLGLRRGEALGLQWTDIEIRWRHGCASGSACRERASGGCPLRQVKSATLTVRRAVQQFTWQHGCADAKPCGRKYGAHCPHRHSGGVVTTDVKSRAGRRTVGMPHQLAVAIERHRAAQALEHAQAGNLWRDEGWVFTNRLGGPVHPTVDYDSWKALLRKANVRTARLHDARHTAATMLLVLRVPLPAVMEIMGWSDAAIAKRYMHVPHEFLAVIAEQVGGFAWASPTDDDDDGEVGGVQSEPPTQEVSRASPRDTRVDRL